MKKLILLTTFLLLASCKYTDIHLLDEEELTWADAYEDGDVILFKSTNDMDTMYVNKSVSNQVGFWGIPIIDTYNGGASFDNVIIHNQDSIGMFFMLIKSFDENFVRLVSNFSNRYCAAFLQTRNADTKLPIFGRRYAELGTIKELLSRTYTINGVDYNDLLIINDDNSNISMESPNNCEYYIWSKSKGLIQYKYENGDVYDFYKKIPRGHVSKPTND